MPTELTPSPATRFVALDVHRQYLMVGAVDSQQQVVLSPRRFGFTAFAEWAQVHLTHADAVVLEATSNAWLLYDQLQPLVAEVVVAHPQAVKLIAAARVKTDSRDTIKLASRLSANLIPAVWVPPQAVRELRALVEAAWVAVEHHPHWKAQFERLSGRIGKQKVIVAIARKLLVAVWHVLAQQEADTNAQVEAVTRKLLNWISHAGATPGKRRDRLLLLYQYLDQLGLSGEVEQVKYRGATYRLSLRQKALREAQKGSRT